LVFCCSPVRLEAVPFPSLPDLASLREQVSVSVMKLTFSSWILVLPLWLPPVQLQRVGLFIVSLDTAAAELFFILLLAGLVCLLLLKCSP
jgi:hypothetical protein